MSAVGAVGAHSNYAPHPFALLSAVGAHSKLKVGAAERIWGASGAHTLKVHFA